LIAIPYELILSNINRFYLKASKTIIIDSGKTALLIILLHGITCRN